MSSRFGIGLFAIVLAACGDDGGAMDGGDAATTMDSSAPEDTGAAEDAGGDAITVADGATAPDADASITVDSGSSTAAPPNIVSVSWVHGTPCANRDREVTITTTVEDPDTPASELIISGSVTGCTGAIDGVTSTVVCRGTSTTIGYLHAEDEGGRADDEVFNLPYCEDGSHDF